MVTTGHKEPLTTMFLRLFDLCPDPRLTSFSSIAFGQLQSGETRAQIIFDDSKMFLDISMETRADCDRPRETLAKTHALEDPLPILYSIVALLDFGQDSSIRG